MRISDVKWALTETVALTVVSDPGDGTMTVLVEREAFESPAVVVYYGDGVITLNGLNLDLGDDMPAWCGLADEVIMRPLGYEVGTRYYVSAE